MFRRQGAAEQVSKIAGNLPGVEDELLDPYAAGDLVVVDRRQAGFHCEVGGGPSGLPIRGTGLGHQSRGDVDDGGDRFADLFDGPPHGSRIAECGDVQRQRSEDVGDLGVEPPGADEVVAISAID